MFEQFVKERVYLRNVSPRTVDFYRDSWKSFERYGGELTKGGLSKYVIAMREAGVKPVSCNTFISGINAYLNWLHENGHLSERLKIQKLKVKQTVIPHLPESAKPLWHDILSCERSGLTTESRWQRSPHNGDHLE